MELLHILNLLGSSSGSTSNSLYQTQIIIFDIFFTKLFDVLPYDDPVISLTTHPVCLGLVDLQFLFPASAMVSFSSVRHVRSEQSSPNHLNTLAMVVLLFIVWCKSTTVYLSYCC